MKIVKNDKTELSLLRDECVRRHEAMLLAMILLSIKEYEGAYKVLHKAMEEEEKRQSAENEAAIEKAE